MDIQSFIKKFANQFDETELSAFTPETIFRDLEEWNSLIALSIIAMVDEEYGITLSGDDIRKATTIEDIFTTVKSRSSL